MFFDGVGGYTPPPTPNEYNLSLGCDTPVLVPTSDIDLFELTLCGSTYSIEEEFANQADLLSYLNTTFVTAFGLDGAFSIIADELIYTTSDPCVGTNCIELAEAKITEDGVGKETEDGQLKIIE